MEMHRVVVIGAGFAGLNAVKGLATAPVQITLIDRENHHLFQPLLYQVATGGLSPADIASPIRHILRKQSNVRTVLDEVTAIDAEAGTVTGRVNIYQFDTLIVAAGATHNYFGNEEWEAFAPGLKKLEDATDIRGRFFAAFEDAERTGNDNPLTFVVVGAGPTGLEVAGTMAEMVHSEEGFTTIDPSTSRILLIDAAPHILGSYPPVLREKARKQLEELGVEVRTGIKVVEISADKVSVADERGQRSDIDSAITVWAAGVKASPLGVMLGAETDRVGRVLVNNDLTIDGHPNVFVIGDLVSLEQDGEPIPGVAPAAIQMGKHVAHSIRLQLSGGYAKPFRYSDRGSLATIGRSAAVADIRGLRFSGFPAWLAWLLIHIYFLVGFQNRLLVMIQWAFNYISRNRSARLIINHRPPVSRR